LLIASIKYYHVVPYTPSTAPQRLELLAQELLYRLLLFVGQGGLLEKAQLLLVLLVLRQQGSQVLLEEGFDLPVLEFALAVVWNFAGDDVGVAVTQVAQDDLA